MRCWQLLGARREGAATKLTSGLRASDEVREQVVSCRSSPSVAARLLDRQHRHEHAAVTSVDAVRHNIAFLWTLDLANHALDHGPNEVLVVAPRRDLDRPFHR